MGLTRREQAAGATLGVRLPPMWAERTMSTVDEDLVTPDPLDAAEAVVHACARLVANEELSPREGAAIVVKVDREVSHLATRRRGSRDALGISEIVDLYYVCDTDCDQLDEAARTAIETEIREAFRDLNRSVHCGP